MLLSPVPVYQHLAG